MPIHDPMTFLSMSPLASLHVQRNSFCTISFLITKAATFLVSRSPSVMRVIGASIAAEITRSAFFNTSADVASLIFLVD